MSRTAIALFALAALLSAVQWVWARTARHVDLRMLDAHSRRHVRTLLAQSTHIQVAAAALAVSAACLQVALAAS